MLNRLIIVSPRVTWPKQQLNNEEPRSYCHSVENSYYRWVSQFGYNHDVEDICTVYEINLVEDDMIIWN